MGEDAGLNVPTMQAMKPPMIPTSRNGPRSSGLTQAKPAAPRQSNNRIPALLITPCKVMGRVSAHAPVKAPSRFKSGLDVSIYGLTYTRSPQRMQIRPLGTNSQLRSSLYLSESATLAKLVANFSFEPRVGYGN